MEMTAVLLMAYGSPNSLDEVEPYLLDIRGGRPTPPALVAEVRERYAQIGGRSPLLDITRAQAVALELVLNQRADGGRTFRTYVGMRHWEPRIPAALAQIQADGIRRIVGLVMAPHQSRLSTGAYFNLLEKALNELGGSLELVRIEAWFDLPGFIAALAENTRTALAEFSQTPYLLFTAHSLPARILQQGDSYAEQLQLTAKRLAEKLDLSAGRWQFCFQSAGQSQEPWLGPAVEQVIGELAQAGERNILITPIGFVCDHVEILYDLDIHAQQLARQAGIYLRRSPSLNVQPAFIHALADLVLSYVPALPGS